MKKLPTKQDAECCALAAVEPDLRPVEGEAADEELATLAKALAMALGAMAPGWA